MHEQGRDPANAVHILFDLDGTLLDPQEGITQSMAYALQEMGHPVPPVETLCSYIGPPIRGVFMDIFGDGDAAKADLAVTIYRRRYGTVGLFENIVYPGIPDLLRKLRARGKKLFVATSKPQVYTDQILLRFALDGFFDGVYGCELDSARSDKGELIAYLLERESIAPDSAVMIGDRRYDIIGAAKNGVAAIGIAWGHGSVEELKQAGATLVVQTPEALGGLLMRGV